jgi:NhaP-type Na+/H+ or K+/H+ antiporter
VEEWLLTEHLMLQMTSIIVLGIGSQWVAWRLRLPAILLLLLTGLIAGPVSGWLKPDALFGALFSPLVSLSVAIVLFEGGLRSCLAKIF